MNLKNILNKPYKYGFILKNNTYYDKLFKFVKRGMYVNNSKIIFHIGLNKSFVLFKNLNNRLDIYFLKIGICRTIKQSRYLIIYGNILLNNFLVSKPSLKIKNGDYIKIIPFTYNKNIKNNIYILKTYLMCLSEKYIAPKAIININTYSINVICY